MTSVKIKIKISLSPYTCYSLKDIAWLFFFFFFFTVDCGVADISWSFDHPIKSGELSVIIVTQ